MGPFIPFEGLFFSDFLGIAENKNNINGLINVDKVQLFANVLKSIKRAQVIPYKLERNKFISNYISNVPLLSDEQLWSISAHIRTKEKTKKGVLSFRNISL